MQCRKGKGAKSTKFFNGIARFLSKNLATSIPLPLLFQRLRNFRFYKVADFIYFKIVNDYQEHKCNFLHFNTSVL